MQYVVFYVLKKGGGGDSRTVLGGAHSNYPLHIFIVLLWLDITFFKLLTVFFSLKLVILIFRVV